jgi:hypothetical protein
LSDGDLLASLIFKATASQVERILINAINQSIPKGENIFYVGASPAPKLPFKTNHLGAYKIGVYRSRPVNIVISPVGEEVWKIELPPPTLSKQSWSRCYGTWKDLVLSVAGVEIL